MLEKILYPLGQESLLVISECAVRSASQHDSTYLTMYASRLAALGSLAILVRSAPLGDSQKCPEACLEIVAQMVWANVSAPDEDTLYWNTICVHNISVLSIYASTKTYCSSSDFQDGWGQLSEWCDEYASGPLLPASDFAVNLTDEAIQALPVVELETGMAENQTAPLVIAPSTFETSLHSITDWEYEMWTHHTCKSIACDLERDSAAWKRCSVMYNVFSDLLADARLRWLRFLRVLGGRAGAWHDAQSLYLCYFGAGWSHVFGGQAIGPNSRHDLAAQQHLAMAAHLHHHSARCDGPPPATAVWHPSSTHTAGEDDCGPLLDR